MNSVLTNCCKTVYNTIVSLSLLRPTVSRLGHLPQSVFNNFNWVIPFKKVFEMPPKRKAAVPKAKEDSVPVQEIEPEVAPDSVDTKPRNKRGAAKKVQEIEPEVAPDSVDTKPRNKRGAAKKVEEVSAAEPEEVVEKKSRKAASTKTKPEVKEPIKEEPKKTARGKKPAAKPDVEEESVDNKKPKKTARGKKKGEESDANGTEPEIKRASRKKKAEPEPLIEEPKPKGRKKATKEDNEEEKPEKSSSSDKKAKASTFKKRKNKEKVSKEDKKTEKEEKVPLNKTSTDWESIDFTCTKKNGEGMSHNLIISCWNIGGLKSWVKKDCLKFLEYETPDILCIQETKCSEEKLPDEIRELKLYKQYWCSSEKEGYAGVGLFTIKEPISVTYGIDIPELDEDGRCITAEYNEFYLVCVYVPNAGRKLVTLPKRLEWNEAFKSYVKNLDLKKPVIICGDMNVAHNEIDLARPQNNTKNAGFTPEEREGMTEFLGDGYVDTFRKLYPDKSDAYTFWTYMANARAKNVGWRLDYFIVSERILKKVCDNVIRTEVVGSDHCPITLFININAEGPRSVSQ